MSKQIISYNYTHTVTESTTGYFACEPNQALSLQESLSYLSSAPWDDFLHRHVLRSLASSTLEELQALWRLNFEQKEKDILGVLLLECAIVNPSHASLSQSVEISQPWQELTPLPYLAWSKLENRELHSAWAQIFSDNIFKHEKLPHPEELDDELKDELDNEGLKPLYTTEALQEIDQKLATVPTISELYLLHKDQQGLAWSRPEAKETAMRALNLLVEAAVLDGVEMRHENSLSPIALLRPWAVYMQVINERNNFNLQGQATTYGRGLSLAQARASYSMEMIERASAYVNVADNKVLNRDNTIHLYRSTYSQMIAHGHHTLNPNALPLETPYDDAPLYWLEAKYAQSCTESDTIFIPAQYVFLFSNLDEPTLMMNPGSTGLASGNSLAEAKLAALTEIIERDALATIPFDRKRCFVLRSKDERIESLLADYAARDIHIHFMDMTTEFGLPCYKAFVIDKKGNIIQASGAGLSGQKAALAALTEVPYAYPNGQASGPLIKNLPERYLEDLPDYSLDSPSRNVSLLEDVLIKHGYTPIYIDITHEDLEMPVVRALIPGLELGAELDRFSNICARLYRNYLQMFKIA